MLQMRPWKMSLVLEGNNNSTFQLLQHYKLLCFPLLKYTAKETLNVIELDVLLYLNLGFLPLLRLECIIVAPTLDGWNI